MPTGGSITKTSDGWAYYAEDSKGNMIQVMSNQASIIVSIARAISPGATIGDVAQRAAKIAPGSLSHISPGSSGIITVPPAERIGDSERDNALDKLSRHFQDGRLRQGEFEERSSAALAAFTQPELDKLLADMPLLPAVIPVLPGKNLPDLELHRARRVVSVVLIALVMTFFTILILAAAA